MAAGEITLDGLAIGAERFSIYPKVSGGQEDLLLAERGTFPAFNRSITGAIDSALPFYKPQRIFAFNYWVTITQRYSIDKLFLLANSGRRLRTPSRQYQFGLEDEREKMSDVYPPARSYVAGSLEVDNTGTIQTSLYYPIYNVVFASEPQYPDTSLTGGVCFYRAVFALVEGDLR